MGVRTCELKILMENVNLNTGEIIIADSKNGDRIVYMNEEVTEFLCAYSAMIEEIYPYRKYLFPASQNQSFSGFAKHFCEIWMAFVPDTGHGSPRLYDFRHHFLYRNVELYMRNGGDVNALRPYIMKHMGHKLPVSFQYYFHLSPPIRKELSELKNDLDWMIPDAPEVPYE
jgi:site-specific recombinase XerD